MPLATTDDVRQLGRLPDLSKLPNDDITPHLNGAARELKSWIGEYEDTDDTEKASACVEAECCLCMAYLQPVLQTLYTEGVTTLQRELGEMEVTHLAPGDWNKVAKQWTERARNRMRDYVADNEAKPRVGWYAI